MPTCDLQSESESWVFCPVLRYNDLQATARFRLGMAGVGNLLLQASTKVPYFSLSLIRSTKSSGMN